ncbi:tetratricopeptide repeat protein [Aquimonas voraii]|uniref:PAS fold n=1 Tax=Aquimonas voraii TaxID=265719 RepID=A0A1G6XD03_9GAMM|nr:tetratricopeptide repeat protein [Aquimonas voraii]SDD76089.1 PAS fold [Aquimonas voraii]
MEAPTTARSLHRRHTRDPHRRRGLVCACLLLGGIAPLQAVDLGCALPAPPAPARDSCVTGRSWEAALGAIDEAQRVGAFEEAERQLHCAWAELEVESAASTEGAVVIEDERPYLLVRRWGILDYRRERLPQALSWFECALKQAKSRGDRAAIAREEKNIGSVLRRLGDFSGALRALTASLETQREIGAVSGAVLNNIADVHRDLEDHDSALRYYREALSAFDAAGETLEASHVLESMSELSLDRGDTRSAQDWLRTALESYRAAGLPELQLRAHGGLIRAALDADRTLEAREWSASALTLARQYALQPPAYVERQIARSERAAGELAAAERRLRAVIARLAEGDTERPALIEALATLLEARGDLPGALREARRAHLEQSRLAHAQQDRQLGWLRARFELSERDHTIAALAADKAINEARLRQRTLVLGLALALTLAGLLALWVLQQRRSQRERLRIAAERMREQDELLRYRREADSLAEDRSLLQALLDSRESALCLLDADGQLLAANRSARRVLELDPEAPMGRSIVELLFGEDAAALTAALERMEDAEVHGLELTSRNRGPRLQARLRPWGEGEGLVVMELNQGATVPESPSEAHAPVRQATDAQPLHEEFKRSIVELMLAVVDAWERATGSNRLELAEKSRIWRVSIDDGRLRARAMERYLAVSKLPRNPRWRDVLRSAYFVLSQCTLDPTVREDLKRRADAVLAYTRRKALA